MKKNNILKPLILFLVLISVLMMTFSCQDIAKAHAAENNIKSETPEAIPPRTNLSEEFKTYWYSGEAEITSYKLEQARYGELREGSAVLVYVTEDFLPNTQVKADNYKSSNVPVLKLNSTKKFNTGIYPYSIMQSTFFPVANNSNAIKISASVQEWCGQVYAQLNNRERFEITAHSYFQGEADESYALEKTWTENELWTKLRIDPSSMPTGELMVVPSLEYTRLKHEKIKPFPATATMKEGEYTITYPDLYRTLNIKFNPTFPYDIAGWEESTVSGYGINAKTLTTKATRINTLKTDYWTKNNNSDESLRETLKLK